MTHIKLKKKKLIDIVETDLFEVKASLSNIFFNIYDFKQKGGDILRGRYFELLPPPPLLCDLTLKWS